MQWKQPITRVYIRNYSLLRALSPWGNPVLLTAMGGETLN